MEKRKLRMLSVDRQFIVYAKAGSVFGNFRKRVIAVGDFENNTILITVFDWPHKMDILQFCQECYEETKDMGVRRVSEIKMYLHD